MQKKAPIDVTREFYRVPTIAKMLDVSKGHVWDLVKAGVFTRIKASEQITLISAKEVHKWIADHQPAEKAAA